jgi:hypothetical protein
MDKDLIVSALLVFAGGFSITGAVMDWDWFMESSRARLFVSLLGRDGARAAYVVLGLAIAGTGLATAGTGLDTLVFGR